MSSQYAATISSFCNDRSTTGRRPAIGWAALLVAASALGCSSEESSAQAPPESGSLTLAPPPEGQGTQLKLAWRLEPGAEKTNCLVRAAPAGTDGVGMYVTAFEHEYTQNASHHALLYSTGLTPDALSGYPEGFVEDCAGMDAQRLGVYYGTQAAHGAVTMPPDVGLLLPSSSVVMLEFHTINTGLDPVDVELRMNVEYTDVKPAKEAGVLFHYGPAIHVAPASSAKAGMHCGRPIDINLLSVASHMHARGIGFTASILDASGGNPTPLYETRDWEAPASAEFDPPLRLSKDQTIDFECHYENAGANEYFQGFSAATDEMCVLVGLYYADEGVPRMESNPFASSGSPEWCQGSGSRPRGFGTGGCPAVRQCVEQINDEVGTATNPFTTPKDANHRWQQCVVESSDAALVKLNDYLGCRATNCRDTCLTSLPGSTAWPISSAECQACLSTNCTAQIDACIAT